MPDRRVKTPQSAAHPKKEQQLSGIPETRDQVKGGQSAHHPPDRRDEALKRYENLNEKPEEHKEHSLQEQAKARALHPGELNAGTPYDWEDLEAYRKELERLDREPPKGSETP